MKKLILGLCLIASNIAISNKVYGQYYKTTTVSKSCGSCGGTVSNNSRVGMRCPHCGVRWGYENERQTTSYNHSHRAYGNTYTGTRTIYKNGNLRVAPSTKSKVITQVSAFSMVNILSKKGSWYYVEYQGFDYGNFRTYKGYMHQSLFN